MRIPTLCSLTYSATPIDAPPGVQPEEAIVAEHIDVYFQVTARDAVLVATAQPITKDLADSVAHTAAIHSKSFAKRRSALLDNKKELDRKETCKKVMIGVSVPGLALHVLLDNSNTLGCLPVYSATVMIPSGVDCFPTPAKPDKLRHQTSCSACVSGN